MARMIGFRPPDEDYDEEARRGRSSRTGRYTRMEMDDEYEGRERGRYGEGERFERRGGYRSRYDDDERMGGYESRRGGRGYRSRMEEGRRGREDDDDGYD